VNTVEARASTMSAETGSTSVNIGRLIPFITLVTIIHALSMAVNSFIPLFLIDRFGIDKTLGGINAL
jgi:hypothetical protein